MMWKIEMFNNFGDYNAEEERERMAAIIENFNTNYQEPKEPKEPKVPSETIQAKPFIEMDFVEIERRALATMPTAKIENNGGFYSTTCPQCGKIKILSSELNTMTAVCNGCYCSFILEKT